ncbi:DNA replication and repair protein RecF [Pediococcus pentosaceus]|uniref:AAA family ATPase n=1 Tax=Pediococcus pentosaceus TaxID=1255 RepID=UPI00136280E8|nr:AAA family ATPase [Pediococcus pentosaceus]QHM59360.1 DNA replication and repair protein RecF [Pediococcus pentosaceus]
MTKIKVLGVSMKIKELRLQNVGNITDISLHFNENVNVICGTNGIGKTTILKSILMLFELSDDSLKKKYGTDKGFITGKTFEDVTRKVKVTSVLPEEENGNYDNTEIFMDDMNSIYYVPDSRNLKYKRLDFLGKYPSRRVERYNQNDFLKNDIADNLKNWLIKQFIAGALNGKETELSDNDLFNIDQIKRAFSIIDEKIEYKKIDMDKYEILLNDRNNEVYLEFESTGFKNVLFIVAGIIAEIRERFRDIKITDFDGIILIDEVDAHLHPTWQNKIMDILKEMFPKTQFIITTHSPAVLQSLNKEEIIPLYLEGDEVMIKTLNLSEYGLKGWTLEEILTDVMGVGELKNKILQESLDLFSRALDQKDIEKAKVEYEKLGQMLHPQSALRQVLDIQKAGLF